MRFIRDVLSTDVIFNKRTPKCFLALLGYILLNKNALACINSIHKSKYDFKKASHPTARELKNKYPHAFNEFFTFCFIRNPYDKVVSEYLFQNKKSEYDMTFLSFLKDLRCREQKADYLPTYATNWPFYAINDEPAVDYIAKFEDLVREIERVSTIIGIDIDADEIPIVKKQSRRDYRSYYDERKKQLVEDIYSKEIKYFNYEF